MKVNIPVSLPVMNCHGFYFFVKKCNCTNQEKLLRSFLL